MWITDLFIRRPVFAIVFNLLLVLFGLYGASRLPIRHLPDIDPPALTVETTLAGASAQEMESQVSAVIETAISAVAGIDVMSSSSSAGTSAISVQFNDGVDLNQAADEVRAQVGDILSQLPANIDTPTVSLRSNAAQPIIYLALSSSSQSPLALTDLAEQLIKPQLTGLTGVSDIQIYGERQYAMRVWLDSGRLASHGVTVSDVTNAIEAENVDLPAGSLDDGTDRTSVASHASLDTPEEFNNVVLRRGDGYLVRIGDVGNTVVGAKDPTSSVLADGSQALAIGVLARSDANPLDVAKAVRAALPALQAGLPADTKIEAVFDETVFISAAMNEVFRTVFEAVVLVVLVIMVFLGSLRASFVTLVTIPVSLVTTLGVLFLIGFSLNTFTLLALVLAVGLVVDDAIVDVENVQRHIGEGRSAIDAAFIGSREIGFAVIATTLTLTAVYVPVALIPGTLGRLFVQFAVTLAVAVLISGLVSRTLSPMMCSRVLRSGAHSLVERMVEAVFDRLAGIYRRVLLVALTGRWLILLAAVIVGAIAVLYVKNIEFVMAPNEDEGYLMAFFTGPQQATLGYMEPQAKAVDGILEAVPEKASTVVIAGAGAENTGLGFLVLKPWDQRTRGAQEIAATLWPPMAGLPGVRGAVINPDPLGTGGGYPIQYVVKTTGSYQQLAQVVDSIVAKARTLPSIAAISSDLSFGMPQVEITVDRAMTASLGIDAASVADTLSVMLGGARVTRFSWQDQLYDVMVELQPSDRRTVADLDRIFLRSAAGPMVPLSAVATIKEDLSARSLSRFAQERSATLNVAPAAGHSTAEALADLQTLATSMMPAGFSPDYAGPTRQLEQSSGSTAMVLGLGFLTIFLVLAAQFESFRDPVIILAVAPLTLIAGMFGLKVLGGSLNAYSGIGLITLIGLIAKHGILITEFANKQRDDGVELVPAVIEAAVLRLRPILMTVIAAAAGALPLLYASGAGAASRQQIGAVIVVGLVLGTLVSLFVVPAIYTMLTPRIRKPLVEPPPR